MIIFIIFTFFIAFAHSEESIEKAFKSNEVIPDVISTAPEKVLDVEYIQSGKKVDLGNELTPTQVKDIPEVKYDADPDSFYTLIMTDPDAPSKKNPTRREWNHWLVVNIPGSKLSQGEVIAGYVGAGPPKDTGLHRYVLLLYKQPKKLLFDEPRHGNTDGNRLGWDTGNFTKKYDLGNPVAGNFFQSEYDDYVPELYKQLGLA